VGLGFSVGWVFHRLGKFSAEIFWKGGILYGRNFEEFSVGGGNFPWRDAGFRCIA